MHQVQRLGRRTGRGHRSPLASAKLNVRPVFDFDGVETDSFEIVAGGRRLQALSLLVEKKRLAETAPIPCTVRDEASEILAEDESLTENMQRVALHPLDQFRAFQALRQKGQGEKVIAAGFFVTPQIVKKRLKLASMAPAPLKFYAEDGITLKQLMAFTMNAKQSLQVQVWDAVENS
jgi:ParB family chromosome partitioning protein